MKNKSKSSTKPVYSAQIEGAANNVNNAFASQQPKITAATDMLNSFLPGIAEQYAAGDPNVKAASGYNLDVLNGKYLNNNPTLQGMVDMTNNSVRNGVTASLGTRGLTGGSAHSDIVSRALADNETKLRYGDYTAERGRMDSAAAMAPALSSAQYIPLSIMEQIARAQQMPVQSAAGAGSAVGGLLGQYVNGTQTQSGSIGGLIAQLGGSALSGWASGGFK